MKQLLGTLLVIGGSLSFLQCGDTCQVINTYRYYEPVYSTSAEVRAAVRFEEPKELSNPGRIYFKDNFLFINESGEGIHVIDNNDPASPVSIGFLKIPGNFELAILGNRLYADSFIDLVVFDVSNISAIKEVGRVDGVFTEGIVYGYPVSTDGLVLTRWEEKQSVQINESPCYGYGPMAASQYMTHGSGIVVADGFNPNGPTAQAKAGVGGSMAKFTISHDYLYALNGGKLKMLSLDNPNLPVDGNEIYLWDAETLFPNDNNLFIGSRSGMYIYDLQIPGSPSLLSKYEHIRSCDPVVVSGAYAYVTLRSGSECEGFTNQLEVIDITNLAAPQLVKIYPMTNPHGLGIDGSLLFICDGVDGLKVFDAANIETIDANQLGHFPGNKALDIIPFQNVAMMIGEDGLYQYNYTNPADMFLLSKLPIVR